MKKLLSDKRSSLFPIILLATWIVAALLVNPLGDFPLNDDFAFGRTVFNLTEKKQLLFDKWLSMTLIAQVFWGGLFCKIAGFSFSVLRVSTLVLAFLGLLSFFRIARELGQTPVVSFWVTALLAFNPLFFSLSFTFMSDVPFASTMIMSILFFILFFKRKALVWLGLATCLAFLATFIRQLGLMLPASFALVWMFCGKLDGKRISMAFAPLIIIGTALMFYQHWFEATQGLPDTYGTFSKLFNRVGHATFLQECLERIGMLLIYMGLFFAPVSFLLMKKTFSVVQWIVSAFFIAFGLWAMLSIWDRFPWGNTLYNIGLGPKLLKDGYFFINVSPTLPTEGIRAVSIIGVACGILLIINTIQVIAKRWPGPGPLLNIRLFILINILLYGGFLMLDTHFFDRYFIPLLPFTILLLLTQQVNISRKWVAISFALFTMVIMGVFSIAATHDYMSWNRARWEALDHLTHKAGISPNQIDGGFEFNGWHRPIPGRVYDTQKSWWWVDREDYVVSFGDLGGFRKIKAFSYPTYLPPKMDSLFILKKLE